MRILITGSNGFLGSHLTHFFSQTQDQVFATSRGPCRDKNIPQSVEYFEMDITDKESVDHFVQEISPDVIIHNAAMSKPNDCHFNREACLQINVEATKYLMEAAESLIKNKKIHFIFLSTDFVFGENGPHAEGDTPGPLNFYGESKLMAEKIVSNASIPYAIVRPVFIYGPVWEGTRNSFIQWVKDSLEKKQTIQVVSDEARTPTYVMDICKGMQVLIKKKKTGIFHFAGKEILTPVDIAIATATTFDLDVNLIEIVKGADLKQPVLRPRKSGLTYTRAAKELGYKPVSFMEGLRQSFE